MRVTSCAVFLVSFSLVCGAGQGGSLNEWNPRERLLEALVKEVPTILKTQDKQTGRFGTEPWICRDQNVVFPLAAAWAIQDPKNPHYHSRELLEAIMKGGDALIAEQDGNGMWTFRKKDNSTWGQTLMPWTYSRWIRAFHLIREAMPEERRQHWEKGLLLGFERISKTCLGHVHNIPAHHAMGLYCAGLCFNRDDWKKQAKEFMAKVVAAQAPGGWWSEHHGPVVLYNFVYVDALGVYYAMSRDASVLEPLRRTARFHATFTYPDGSKVETVDERNAYHPGISESNVGFSFTPQGRGYLLHLSRLHDRHGSCPDADYAASLLLYGETGPAATTPAERDESLTVVGANEGLVLRQKPWFVCLSAFTCKPTSNRWTQDRQNFVSVYHDAAGLIIGGGNTKLQPFWSNFTVGDTALLSHKPGDENPDFKSKGDLIHVPSQAVLRAKKDAPGLDLKYGAEDCRITVYPRNEKQVVIVCEAAFTSGKPVEGHLTLMPHLGASVTCASGKSIKLGDESFEWPAVEMGGWMEHHGCRFSIPSGARLLWPKKPHNPYKKDGSSRLEEARLVLCLPFSAAVTQQEVTLTITR